MIYKFCSWVSELRIALYTNKRFDQDSIKFRLKSGKKPRNLIVINLINSEGILWAFGIKGHNQAVEIIGTIIKKHLRENEFLYRIAFDKLLLITPSEPYVIKQEIQRIQETIPKEALKRQMRDNLLAFEAHFVDKDLDSLIRG